MTHKQMDTATVGSDVIYSVRAPRSPIGYQRPNRRSSVRATACCWIVAGAALVATCAAVGWGCVAVIEAVIQ